MTRGPARRRFPGRVLGLLASGCLGYPAFHGLRAQDLCADPEACVEALHHGLTAASREMSTGDFDDRYASIEPVISATHDLAEIARVAVRRHWTAFSAEEQTAFVTAFSRLSVATYAARFTELPGDAFRILEVDESAPGRARVVAAIARPPQPDIPLEYVLREGGGGWRIVNVIADGVSDLALRRAEYHRLLEEGSAAELIAELELQIDALRR